MKIKTIDMKVKKSKSTKLFGLTIVNGVDYDLRMLDLPHKSFKIKSRIRGIKSNVKIAVPVILDDFIVHSEKEIDEYKRRNIQNEAKCLRVAQLQQGKAYNLSFTIPQYETLFKPFLDESQIDYNEIFRVRRSGYDFGTRYFLSIPKKLISEMKKEQKEKNSKK